MADVYLRPRSLAASETVSEDPALNARAVPELELVP